MFKDKIGVYRENSGKQEINNSGENMGGGVKFAACGGLIKIAMGFISVSNEFNHVHANSRYIYFKFSTCFGQLCAHHQKNLLYLCDTGIFHYVWVAVWSATQQSRGVVTDPCSYRISEQTAQ